MFFKVVCRDHKNWPIITVEPPVRESGDTLRLQNFTTTVFNDFGRFARRQRELTKEAIENKGKRSPTTFGYIFLQAVLGKPFEEAAKQWAEENGYVKKE